MICRSLCLRNHPGSLMRRGKLPIHILPVFALILARHKASLHLLHTVGAALRQPLPLLMALHSLLDQHVDVASGDPVHNTNACVNSVVVTTTHFRLRFHTQNNLRGTSRCTCIFVMQRTSEYHHSQVYKSPLRAANGRTSFQGLTQMAHLELR